jgi:DNA polymerase III subunit delta
VKISPALFLIGKDAYQIRLQLEELRSNIFPKGSGGLNDDTFEAKQRPLNEILDLCNTLPMLAPQRLVTLRNIDKLNESDQEKLTAYAIQPCPQTTFVAIAEKLDKRTKMFKTLDKAGLIRSVEEPKARDMQQWVDRIAKKHSVELHPNARRALVEAVGTNLSLLDQQMEKLALYIHPEKTVPAQAVAEMVLDSTGDTIFAWTDQVVEGRSAEAMNTLNYLFDSGNPALVMMAMLARHVRILMKAKDLTASRTPHQEWASALGVPPFTVQRYVEQSRRFSLPTLIEFLGELANLDHDLKSTGLPPKLLLERAIRAL